MSTPSRTIITASFLTGFALASFLRLLDKRKTNAKNRTNAGAYDEGNDVTMFYGSTEQDHDNQEYIAKEKQYLSADLYGQIVRNTVVVCVDCLIVKFNVHTNRHECLLVERADEPAKNLWWLPGGRLYKGETFFDGALRKVKEETGLDTTSTNSDGTTSTNVIRPIQVLGFYNTFFPTSSWDTDTDKGTQTVQPIILVKIETAHTEILLDRTSERYRWIGLDPEEAKSNGEDRYVIDALLKYQAWDLSYGSTSGI
eukprot:CAMPEP_0203675732 /NCGR_PEP_ID=MMETSP0090-20130426/21941_1 /ASSEMBLY_ACC=CAM_ASM_001088 /TAXON_ID=426623 /ORGANISM="Chaetoceros affinis, Strain CCMP159" /LENGTH=254 /DNA_ID=CAMNT_0050542041 /DNA_START=61 /DNA_END=825 /DNA_ORIENTATION=-